MSLAKSLRDTRHRVDIDSRTRLVIDDLLDRGLYRDQQEVMATALAALQIQLANEAHADEYDNEQAQSAIDHAQLEGGEQ